jgi:hypothetical protein
MYPGVDSRSCSGPRVGVGRVDGSGRDTATAVGIAVDGVIGGEGGGRLLEVSGTIVIPSTRRSVVEHPAAVGVRIGKRGLEWEGASTRHPFGIDKGPRAHDC